MLQPEAVERLGYVLDNFPIREYTYENSRFYYGVSTCIFGNGIRLLNIFLMDVLDICNFG